MTVQDYLRVLREQWIIVVSVVLVALAGSAAVWTLRPTEYTAHLTFYVSAQSAESATAAYQGSLLSQQRVSSYVELVGGTRVSREVIRDLGLPATPEAVAAQITASSAPDSVLIDVDVVGPTPEWAVAVADAVGRAFPGIVAELERPSDPAAAAPVAVRVVEPAAAPTSPSSTGLLVTLALGGLAGAAAGLGLAFARSAMDTSIKTLEQLREAAHAPNLGTITYDSNVPRRPLTVHENVQSPRAEAFRQLRTNLQFVEVDRPQKIIIMTSPLPGDGKTTTLCNLAIALAAAERRVLVVEADLRRPKVADLLGLDRSVGLTNVLAGRIQAHQVIQPWAGGRFDVLASGPLPPNPSELLESRQMAALLDELRSRYDFVLVDTPPLLPVTDAAAVAPASDGAILVCRFKKSTRDQVRRATEALAAVSMPVLGTILTMVPSSGPLAYGRYSEYYRTEEPRSVGSVGDVNALRTTETDVPGGSLAPDAPPDDRTRTAPLLGARSTPSPSTDRDSS